MSTSGTHLYKWVCPLVCRSVCPSVRPSVCPLRKCKNRVSWLFLATVRSYSETNDQPTCFESLLYDLVFLPICSSICLFIYVTWSIHAKTQPGRIVARSGLLLSFLLMMMIIIKFIQQKELLNIKNIWCALIGPSNIRANSLSIY